MKNKEIKIVILLIGLFCVVIGTIIQLNNIQKKEEEIGGKEDKYSLILEHCLSNREFRHFTQIVDNQEDIIIAINSSSEAGISLKSLEKYRERRKTGMISALLNLYVCLNGTNPDDSTYDEWQSMEWGEQINEYKKLDKNFENPKEVYLLTLSNEIDKLKSDKGSLRSWAIIFQIGGFLIEFILAVFCIFKEDKKELGIQ